MLAVSPLATTDLLGNANALGVGGKDPSKTRDALDAASAGVLVAVGTAILVGLVIFGPRVLALLGFCD